MLVKHVLIVKQKENILSFSKIQIINFKNTYKGKVLYTYVAQCVELKIISDSIKLQNTRIKVFSVCIYVFFTNIKSMNFQNKILHIKVVGVEAHLGKLGLRHCDLSITGRTDIWLQ